MIEMSAPGPIKKFVRLRLRIALKSFVRNCWNGFFVNYLSFRDLRHSLIYCHVKIDHYFDSLNDFLAEIDYFGNLYFDLYNFSYFKFLSALTYFLK